MQLLPEILYRGCLVLQTIQKHINRHPQRRLKCRYPVNGMAWVCSLNCASHNMLLFVETRGIVNKHGFSSVARLPPTPAADSSPIRARWLSVNARTIMPFTAMLLLFRPVPTRVFI